MRLEAHGEEFKLVPLYKINALCMLMTRKAKGYFDFWEADHDPTKAAKKYEELLSKVKDYARGCKFDSSANEKIQQGGDLMYKGAVGGWNQEDYDQDGAHAMGFKGKGKGKGGAGK